MAAKKKTTNKTAEETGVAPIISSLDQGKAEGLYFLPLGGVGGFGLNCSLYYSHGEWLMVDLGLGFADDSLPGVEIVLPDLSFIAARHQKLVGLVLTHAHEDHIGAVPYLWHHLKCPIYGSAFTLEMVRQKLVEHKMLDAVPLKLIDTAGYHDIGGFSVQMVGVTHSIPETRLLSIRTPYGTVVHTGDWKLDDTPVVGAVSEVEAIKAIASDKVLALVGDSTNALTEGWSGSEGTLLPHFTRIFEQSPQRVAVACFSSNVARLTTVAQAAREAGRSVGLVGRSLWRIADAARRCGYLADFPEFLTERQAAQLPSEKLVLMCTGSQGEPRAALPRIAQDEHPDISLDDGDVVIFSARTIPGNEKNIYSMQNQLLRHGIKVITDGDDTVHVSGHPQREEMRQLYRWLQPQLLLPVHGEFAHLEAHAKLAKECGVAQTLIPENGQIIRLDGNEAHVVAEIDLHIQAVDGDMVLPFNHASIRARRRLSEEGAVVASLALNRKGGLVGQVHIAAPGLLSAEEDKKMHEQIIAQITDKIDAVAIEELRSDDVMREHVRLIIRRFFQQKKGKRPLIDVHLIRV
ncbi:MAG: ribonuclease J [Alphaproteobacteria bacterium]